MASENASFYDEINDLANTNYALTHQSLFKPENVEQLSANIALHATLVESIRDVNEIVEEKPHLYKEQDDIDKLLYSLILDSIASKNNCLILRNKQIISLEGCPSVLEALERFSTQKKYSYTPQKYLELLTVSKERKIWNFFRAEHASTLHKVHSELTNHRRFDNKA